MSEFDNPPAFPIPAFESQGNTWGHPPQEGMTLRQWYAGKILAGMMAGGYPPSLDTAKEALQMAHWLLQAEKEERP